MSYLNLKKCRECQQEISEQAFTCPNCGAPFPAREKWDGWGYEYKSKVAVMGLPLVHISFKYSPKIRPVVARGIVAIGQFAVGVITVSQFGIGVISISQFTIAVLALAQFALAYSLVAQIGLYIDQGYGQLVWNLIDLLKQIF